MLKPFKISKPEDKSSSKHLSTMEKPNNSYYKSLGYYADYLWGKSRTYLMPLWSTRYAGDKITDQIYISDLPSAFNKDRLREEGITHIVNMIIGVDSLFPGEFKYKNIPARDIKEQDLSQYFDECVEFIDNAIKEGGKVLVHCSQGISRSATIVIAYLISIGISYDEAFNMVKEKRSIINPNAGFKDQLLIYERQFLEESE